MIKKGKREWEKKRGRIHSFQIYVCGNRGRQGAI